MLWVARTCRRYHLQIREARVGVLQRNSPITQTDPTCRYKLAAIKLVTPSKEHLEKHYEDLSEKPFFKGLVTCMSFPTVVMYSYPDNWYYRHVEWSDLRDGMGRT